MYKRLRKEYNAFSLVGEVKEFVKKVNNVENVVEKNVTYDRKGK